MGILNNPDRNEQCHSNIAQTLILLGSKMKNKNRLIHNWKRAEVQKDSIHCKVFVTELSSSVCLLLCVREYSWPVCVCVWDCVTFMENHFVENVWGIFILLLLKHEVCHHDSHLFPFGRIMSFDLGVPKYTFIVLKQRKSTIQILSYSRRSQVWDLYSSRKHRIQTFIRRITWSETLDL